ncbi:NmrA family NAD(P)-binding protein [Streptomyces sp. SDT5-1]|uniref:NmrA family NAD(P)-binding protein n=1 Tax=Streptomyces sp. SDT5-1 TaxID=3406418 RepID=UPI003FD33B02
MTNDENTREDVRPVLVTGATGRIGRAVVDELLAAGIPVRALTRDPAKAELPDGVEVVAGDFTDPASLDPALRGARSVFLLWTAPPATTASAIDRVAAHVRRIVFLSSPHRTAHPFFRQPNPMADLHAEIERLITAAGLDATVLRPGMFASNARLWWEPAIRAGAPVRWPYADVETAPVDERDLAAVAARTLYESGHTGGDYVLTGPEALSHADQVRVIGEVIGREIPFEELTPDAFRRTTDGVWPRPVVDMLLDAWGAADGHPAYVTTTVADVLGRARTFRESVADYWKTPL